MHLAVEYLARKGVLHDMFSAPCSLFLENDAGRKVVLTITEEFTPSPNYSLKRWDVQGCKRHCALPSFTERIVPKSNLFTAAVLANHGLLACQVCPVPFAENEPRLPMLSYLYNQFFNNYLEPSRHRQHKQDWLWAAFVGVYVADLFTRRNYIVVPAADRQRQTVEKEQPSLWSCWLRWCRYLFSTNPAGELIFSRLYSRHVCPEPSKLLLP